MLYYYLFIDYIYILFATFIITSLLKIQKSDVMTETETSKIDQNP